MSTKQKPLSERLKANGDALTLDGYYSEHVAVIESVRELEAENADLKEQLTSDRNPVYEDVLMRNQALMVENERLKGELTTWRGLNANAHGQQACIDTLHAELDKTKAAYGDLSSGLEALERERDDARAEAQTLQHQRDKARAKLRDWKASVDYANVKRDAALAKLEDVREHCHEALSFKVDYQWGLGMDCMARGVLAILDSASVPDSADSPSKAVKSTAKEQHNGQSDTDGDNFETVMREVVLWRATKSQMLFVDEPEELELLGGDQYAELAHATVTFRVPRPKKSLAERLEQYRQSGDLDSFKALLHDIADLEERNKVSK